MRLTGRCSRNSLVAIRTHELIGCLSWTLTISGVDEDENATKDIGEGWNKEEAGASRNAMQMG
jgi:hypothetical protein